MKENTDEASIARRRELNRLAVQRYREKNSDKVRESARVHMAQRRAEGKEKPVSREASRSYAAKWRTEHPEEAKASHERWRQKNREHLAAYHAKWAQEHPENMKRNHEHWRRVHIHDKYKYGLPKGAREQMYEEQQGCCAACFEPFFEGQKVCVDHCHTTHVVRGLVHDDCNIAMGRAFDDPIILRRLADYLERGNE